MKLEVGMYVRTLHNGIAKILEIDFDNRYWDKYRIDKLDVFIKDYSWIRKQDIVKTSYDTLDLIEKDDVIAYYNKLQDVKGLIIERVQDNNYIKRLREFVQAGTINIVRVMTHEQFGHESYKIGG